MIKSIILQNSPLMSLPVKGQLVSLFIHTILITYNFGLPAYHSRSHSKPKLYNVESYDSKRAPNTRIEGTLVVTQVWNNKTVFHRGKNAHLPYIYKGIAQKSPYFQTYVTLNSPCSTGKRANTWTVQLFLNKRALPTACSI